MNHKNIWLSSLLLLTIHSIIAQYKVNGIVVDEENNPIPFVNVYFENSSVGGLTDVKGEFELETQENYQVLVVSLIGFAPQSIQLKKSKLNELNIVLLPEQNSLDEVLVSAKSKNRLKKKENPAYKILKKIWEHRNSNGDKIKVPFQVEKHTYSEIGFANLGKPFLSKIIGNKNKAIINDFQKDYERDNYYVPMGITDKVELIYRDDVNGKKRVDVEGEREVGINDLGIYAKRLVTVFNEIDIYKNNIYVLNKAFVSPISKVGFASYDYILADSISVNGNKEYKIYFFPRQKGDLVFRGKFTVTSKTYSIKEIDMEVYKDVNLNFIKNLELKQTFKEVKDSIFLPSSFEYRGEFTILTKSEKEKLFYLNQQENFSKYLVDTHKTDEFYRTKIIKKQKEQFAQEKSYWDEKSTSFQKENVEIVKSVTSNSRIKNISGAIKIISNGYISPIKGFQIGSIYSMFSNNDVEGLKSTLGFRTLNSIDDKVKVLGYGGYGEKNKKGYYAVGVQYLILPKPRLIVEGSYTYDSEQLGFTSFDAEPLIFDPNNRPSSAFVRGENYFIGLTDRKFIRLRINPVNSLSLGVSVLQKTIQSATSLDNFSSEFLDTQTNRVTHLANEFSTILSIDYTPKKRVIGNGVVQQTGIQLYPRVFFSIKKSYRGVLESNVDYTKLDLLYSHPIQFGNFGVLKPKVILSKTFGEAPITLINTIPANQTYFLRRDSFILLNYFDFVADASIQTHIEYHFNGFLFNRVPLFKKLKLRSLVTFRGVMGSISDSNININRSNIQYAAPNTKPYLEYGFGIENLGIGNIRPFRVEFIWRNKFESFNGFVSPNFGVRVGVNPRFY